MIDTSKFNFTPEVSAYGLYTAIIGSLEAVATLHMNDELKDSAASLDTWCSWVGKKAADADGLSDADRSEVIERALTTVGPHLPDEFGKMVLAMLERRGEAVQQMMAIRQGQHRHATGIGRRKQDLGD